MADHIETEFHILVTKLTLVMPETVLYDQLYKGKSKLQVSRMMDDERRIKG